jgi:hypothetical protein
MVENSVRIELVRGEGNGIGRPITRQLDRETPAKKLK